MKKLSNIEGRSDAPHQPAAPASGLRHVASGLKPRRCNKVNKPDTVTQTVNQAVNPSTLPFPRKMGAPTIRTEEPESLIL